MEITYQREGNSNYIVAEGKEDMDGFVVQMLRTNRIHGLLPFHIGYLNNKIAYYYDISSKQSLETMLERKKVNTSFLRNLLEKIVQVVKELEDYLLDNRGILLSPDRIYLSAGVEDIFFYYDPTENEVLEKKFESLMKYLLDKVDYQSTDATAYAYALYHECRKPGFQIKIALSISPEDHIEERGKISSEIIYEKNKEEKIKLSNELDEREEREKEKKDEAGEHTEAQNREKGRRILVEPQIPPEMVWEEEEAEEHLLGKKFIYILTGVIVIAVMGVIFYWCMKHHFSRKAVLQSIALGTFFAGIAVFGFVRLQYWNRSRIVSTPVCVSFEKKQEETEEVQELKTILLSYEEDSLYKRLVPIEIGRDVIYLEHFPFFIGKLKEQADYVLNEAGVSRLHAKFERDGDHLYIIDLNSTNGLFVNGVRLAPHESKEIETGCEIRIGNIGYMLQ